MEILTNSFDELTVADFFCGAGGFSEGFRQKGFRILFALDSWGPAIETHRLNHPDCIHLQTDILNVKIEDIDKQIPDTDVIIGSPPCVSFSSSNKAGKADKELGIKLIEKFLQIVAIKKFKNNSKLKYWLMENVPNSKKYLKESYSFSSLGITQKNLDNMDINKNYKDIAISLDFSEGCIYNAVHYGVPQKRKRYICGEHPSPKIDFPNKENWKKLKDILNSFRNMDDVVTDILYNFTIQKKHLTDHFYDTNIHEFDWKLAMIKKQHARYYGKMAFPENEEKPSRTIMATRSMSSRESMIINNGKPNTYRSLTIREVASIMSFPLTYQFQGKNESTKYKLIGNAVCPKLSAAFAESILTKEHRDAKDIVFVLPDLNKLQVNLNDNPNNVYIPKSKHPLAQFAHIVPDLKVKNFRVELDNSFPKKNNGKVVWRASIHHATGKKQMKKSHPKKQEILGLLKQFRERKKIAEFEMDLYNTFVDKIPNSETFQKLFCTYHDENNFIAPIDALKKVKELVDKHFPEEQYSDILLNNTTRKKTNFIKFDREISPNNKIPLRIIMAYIAVNYITKLVKKKNNNISVI